MPEAQNIIDLAHARAKRAQFRALEIEPACYSVHRRLAIAAILASRNAGLCGSALNDAIDHARSLFDSEIPDPARDALDELLTDIGDLRDDAIDRGCRVERVEALRIQFCRWATDAGVPLSLDELGTLGRG